MLADKAVQAAWASTAGVATPDSWSSPDDVPLPAIVKAPVGSGGQGVRVVTTPDELELAWIDLTDAAGRPPFAQRLLRKSVSTGGVALDGRVLVGTAYDGHPAADDPTGPPAVVVAVDDRQARIEVEDRGVGMTDEDLARAFEPFFRSDRSRSRASGGLGLGLFIAKTLLERSGASVTTANRPTPEKGARVTIVWPRPQFERPAGAGARPPATTIRTPGPSFRASTKTVGLAPDLACRTALSMRFIRTFSSIGSAGVTTALLVTVPLGEVLRVLAVSARSGTLRVDTDEGGGVIGIVTHRDVLAECFASPSGWARSTASHVMTAEVVRGAPNDLVAARRRRREASRRHRWSLPGGA